MLRRLACAIILACSTVGLLAVPASAAPTSATRYYLALGDSLAYGYQPVKPLDRTQGYVYQLYDRLRADDPKLSLDNLGCSGETTTTMLVGGICSYPGEVSQLTAAERFLHAHKDKVDLVTLDIGANDVNHCVHGGVIDAQCVPRAMAGAAQNLSEIVSRLRAAAPHTRIVAMTYYDPYLAAWLTGPAGQALAQQSLQFAAVLNTLLTSAYTSGGIAVADVAAAFSTFDSTDQVPLPGVGAVPLDVARICQWTWMCSPTLGPDIHANQQGYAVIAGVFQAVLAA
ncbi:MAG TPA: SGNH/GDSL hydrolase family protein [Micromonosporaceae bacterium]